jgi:hypothetical protein
MAIRQGDNTNVAVLAQRADLPPRVRSLLSGLLEKARAHFVATLPHALDEFEATLFKLAGHAGSNALQQERFEDLREIKQQRAQIAARFLQHIESSLAQIRRVATPASVAVDAGDHLQLELVDASVLEEDLALQEIAGKSEIRHSQVLYALAHRLGVVAGAPAWTNEALPLGPFQLVDAFRDALSGIRLGVESRVLAYRQFDRDVLLPIGALYQTLNTYLTAQRVLPNLQWRAGRQRGDAAREALARHTPPPGEHEPEAAAPFTATSAAAPDADTTELFRTLRHLLGEQRRATRSADPPSGPLVHASREDLQSVLGVLQREVDPRTQPGTSAYESERFKRELLTQLRRGAAHGASVQLAEEDADTVDLVGLLFDYVTANVREGSGARSLLGRLHVPVLRVALGDKTFFTRRSHPARELLNTIAETGARWFDDSQSDPDLSRKMQVVVDHVSADFDGDLSIFENLLGDLGRHMQLLARRAEAVERRHIDAAKGRDKLEIARDTARAAITRVIQGGEPTPRIRALLEQAWTDALALSALRQGSSSAEFKRRLGVAIKLARRGATSSAEIAGDDPLRQELEAGLGQVGLHTDDIDSLLADVFVRPGVPDATSSAEHERVDRLLKDKVRLGGAAAPAPTPTPHAQPPAPLNAAESAMLERMRSIPFGTWFDFIHNQQGATTRRKLAWFSTVTGRCLFVNQRGMRSEDKSLEQLARDLVRGQVRMVVAEETSLIDRAWKAILDTLHLRSAAAAT